MSTRTQSFVIEPHISCGGMSNQETISRVLELVSHLGGPRILPEEIEWATDIPAGKQLLEWLASQLSDPPVTDRVAGPSGDSNHTGLDSNLALQASLSPIALYSDEVKTYEARPRFVRSHADCAVVWRHSSRGATPPSQPPAAAARPHQHTNCLLSCGTQPGPTQFRQVY